MRPFQSPFSVQRATDPTLDAWKGASKFALSAPESAFFTRSQFHEYGPDYFAEHHSSNKRFSFIKTDWFTVLRRARQYIVRIIEWCFQLLRQPAYHTADKDGKKSLAVVPGLDMIDAWDQCRSSLLRKPALKRSLINHSTVGDAKDCNAGNWHLPKRKCLSIWLLLLVFKVKLSPKAGPCERGFGW